MGGFASIVRGALAGGNEAAGNPQTAQALLEKNKQAQEAKQAQLRAQVIPHSIALKGLQERLQALDPSDPHYDDHKQLITNDIARNLHEVRGLLYPDQDPKGNFFERGITDKLHMTSMKNRQDALKQKQEKGQKQDQSSAGAIAEGSVPYGQTPEAQKLNLQAQLKGEYAPENWQTLDMRFKDGTQHTVQRNTKDGRITDLAGNPVPQDQLTSAVAAPKPSADANKREDFEKDPNKLPGETLEQWSARQTAIGRNAGSPAKPPTMKPGMVNGKSAFAYYSMADKSWIDSNTGQPIHNFVPQPSFAQTGLWGLDTGYDAQGNPVPVMMNRRNGQVVAAPAGIVAPAQAKGIETQRTAAIAGDSLLRTMLGAADKAKNKDQQAMLSIVANHIGMTLGAQKGARINQAVWNEATESAPLLQNVEKKWDSDGYLQGVTLSPQQVDQMVELGKLRRDVMWEQAAQTAQASGVPLQVPKFELHPNLDLPKTKELKKTRGSQNLNDALEKAMQGVQ